MKKAVMHTRRLAGYFLFSKQSQEEIVTNDVAVRKNSRPYFPSKVCGCIFYGKYNRKSGNVFL